MRLGISAGFLCEPQWTGVQRYVFHMITALAEIRPHHRVCVMMIVPRALRDRAAALFTQPNIEVRTLCWPQRMVVPLQLFWQQWRRPMMEAIFGRLDAYLSGGGYYLPSGARVRGGFVFDMTPFATTYAQDNRNQRAEQQRLAAMARDPGSLWVAISKTTQTNACAHFRLSSDRVMVAYPGPTVDTRREPRRVVLPKPYLLSVGSLTGRKNISRLVKAFSWVRQKHNDLKLVLMGNNPADVEIGNREGVILPGYVPETDLAAWYRGAEALVYPSLEEGFGLPVLEALSLGVLPITSSGSSMEEIVGADWRYLVDATSSESIRAGIEKVLALSISKRKIQVERAWRKAVQFSFQASAEALWKRLEEGL